MHVIIPQAVLESACIVTFEQLCEILHQLFAVGAVDT